MIKIPDEVERLNKENADARVECKLLAAENERLRAALDVVRASGLLIGSTTLHDRVRAVVHAALTQEPSNDR